MASFFPAFRQERNKPADVEVEVCRDMTCHLRGAAALLAADGLPALAAGLSTPEREVRVEGVSCLGRCDRAPVAVGRAARPDARRRPTNTPGCTPAGRGRSSRTCSRRIAGGEAAAGSRTADAAYAPTHATADAGARDAAGRAAAGWEIDVYGREPDRPRDYRAVRSGSSDCVKEQRGGAVPAPPAEKLGGEELKASSRTTTRCCGRCPRSGLLGMGGAGTPAYQKWLDVWREPGPEKYVVCNGDESEPGTFKDRELLLRLPHLVVEGVILAGLMTGATAGYIYIRHEYHEQIARRARRDRAEAERLGACGPDVFGSGRSFPVEVFESPGGYICGEQSALFEAMEDRRGAAAEPAAGADNQRPPRPADGGEQRRDAGVGAVRPAPRRAGVRRPGLAVGGRRAPGSAAGGSSPSAAT